MGRPRRKDVVTRCRSWTAILALLIVATALVLVAKPSDTAASTLRGRLTHAKRDLRTARHRLVDARAKLATALEAAQTPPLSPVPTPAADPEPAPTPNADASSGSTVAQLNATVTRLRKRVRRLECKVRKLKKAYRLERDLVRWECKRQWRPIIRVAAAKYHVSAARMYRIMMRESRGNPCAGSTYKGLFQYHPATWRARWNPWRHDSIYRGRSQIFATAYAIHRGYGPSMWPNTF